MTVWCGVHKGEVPDGEAEIVGGTETGSGPGLPSYACIGCIRRDGLVPPRYIGRRDAAPIPPGRPA
jgi:hypothetical protein